MLRYGIVPLLRGRARAMEYEADCQAALAGYGSGLIAALRLMGGVARPHNIWQQAVHETHPPTELRIELIEQAMELRQAA